MSKPFKALIAKLPPERQARIQDRTAELSGKMALQELRQALKPTTPSAADGQAEAGRQRSFLPIAQMAHHMTGTILKRAQKWYPARLYHRT